MSTITKKAIAEFRLLKSKYPKMNTKDVIQLLERIDAEHKVQIKKAWFDGNTNTDNKGNPSENYSASDRNYYSKMYEQ